MFVTCEIQVANVMWDVNLRRDFKRTFFFGETLRGLKSYVLGEGTLSVMYNMVEAQVKCFLSLDFSHLICGCKFKGSPVEFLKKYLSTNSMPIRALPMACQCQNWYIKMRQYINTVHVLYALYVRLYVNKF